MTFLHTVVTTVLGLSALIPVFAVTPGFPYGSQKVRGVNLGGWLVLEPWITPSLFDNTGDSRIVDEWTFGQYQNYNTALNTLQNHWNTWITEADFIAIAAAGYMRFISRVTQSLQSTGSIMCGCPSGTGHLTSVEENHLSKANFHI